METRSIKIEEFLSDIHMERPFENRFASKLYDARDVEGKAQREVFEVVQMLEGLLNDIPGFIGIDPFGSTVKGYGSDADRSDIDINILVDESSVAEGDEELGGGGSENRKRKALYARVKRDIALVAKMYPQKISPSLVFINEKKNSLYIRNHCMQLCNPVSWSDFTTLNDIAQLFRRVSGKKIGEYRQRLVNEIQKVPIHEREIMVQLMAARLVAFEMLNWNKIQKRRNWTNQEEQDNFYLVKESREQLWEKRIHSFLEKPDQEAPLEEEKDLKDS